MIMAEGLGLGQRTLDVHCYSQQDHKRNFGLNISSILDADLKRKKITSNCVFRVLVDMLKMHHIAVRNVQYVYMLNDNAAK